MHIRHAGFLKTFGARLGAGLADQLLDRWFPPAPPFLQRFAESLLTHGLPLLPCFLSRLDGTSPHARQPAVAWAPGCGPLGEFTCPKCGGHTWSSGPSLASVEAETPDRNERWCTNGLETAYPEHNPNTVKTPCMFQWKATDDHLYFAKPSAEAQRQATETTACAPSDEFHPLMKAGVPPVLVPSTHILRFDTRDIVDGLPTGGVCCMHASTTPEQVRRANGPQAVEISAISNGKQGRTAGDVLGVTILYPEKKYDRAEHAANADKAWPRPFLGTTPDAVEQAYDNLASVIGNRFAHEYESLADAATRLLAVDMRDKTRNMWADEYDKLAEFVVDRMGWKIKGKDSAVDVAIRKMTAADKLGAESGLFKAVGGRMNPEETTVQAAARLLGEADAFIAKQSKQIEDLILDNVFPAGKGEIGLMLSAEMAKKIGLRYAENAPPIRVALVLDGWQWAVRLGLGRVGGELIKVDWDKADELLLDAKTAWMCSDKMAMGQNAAGGVA